MNPQITALHQLQQRDRRLTRLERELGSIPVRIAELDGDLAKLERLLDSERRKLEETRGFQHAQEMQLSEEEELIDRSKQRMSQVKTSKELNATQRELETTRRMATARHDEIAKIREAIQATEARIAAMGQALAELRTRAEGEKTRLHEQTASLQEKIETLSRGRGKLLERVAIELRRNYERIRTRSGGVAFVAAARGRCTACKMAVPHQMYTALLKGDEIFECEHCGRLMYWEGHFPEEQARREAKAKDAPMKRNKSEMDDEAAIG
jgi:predicted  nucleic acid-binding Zn-ribbon protein